MLNRLLLPILRLGRSKDPMYAASYETFAHPFQVDGKLQSVGSICSAYTRSNVQWVSAIIGREVGAYSGEDLALASLLGTAYLAITGRAGLASEIPLHVVDEADRAVDDSPAQCLVDQATHHLFWATAWKAIGGSWYFWKKRNQWGYPSKLVPLSPLDVTPDVRNRTLYGYYVMTERGQQHVKPSEIVAYHSFHPLSDVEGASALASAMLRVNIEINVSRFGDAFFKNMARPDLVITTKASLTPQQQKDLRTRIEETFKGAANAFRALIMGGAELTVTPINYNPTDLAMVDLTNQSDAKICAGIGINPALVGIGRAADPLSAQATYDSLLRHHMQHIAATDAREFCDTLQSQWLAVDFPDAPARWKLTPDTSAVQSEALGTGERVTTASNAASNHIWTVDESRSYTGKEALPGAIQVNPDWATTAWNAGGLRLSEYRQAIGIQHPALVDGFIYELDPRAKAAPTTANTFTMSYPPVTISQPDPVKQLPEPPAKTVDAQPTRAANGDAYILLSLANDPVLTRIQASLKTQAVDIDWEDPADFHVTLVYAPGATDLATIKNVLPKSINPFTFEVGPLDFFAKADRVPLILRVQPTAALIALQAGLAGAFGALGLALSDYSIPDAWQPHVTLGYMAPGVIELPIWDGTATVTGLTLECSIANSSDQFETIYVSRSKEQQTAQLAELGKWAKIARRVGASARFVTDYVPDDVALFVRSSLEDGWNVSAVFAVAREWLRTGQPQAMGIPDDEARQYWQDFDGLKHDLGTAWLAYMQRVSDQLYPLLLEHPDMAFDAPFEGDELAGLLADWIGTADTPGDLAQLLLAGYAAGQSALDREAAANPHTVRAGLAIAPSISWDLASAQALDFIRQYALNLIKNINDTTKEQIRAAVDQYIAEGQPAEQLQQAIAQALLPPGGAVNAAILNRAALIGQTESMNAFNAGAVKRFQDAGVTQGIFQTVRQGEPHPVCSICKPLHGTAADLSVGWPARDGKKKLPPLHPGCRCYIRPQRGGANG